MPADAEPHAGGRPTDYRSEYCARVIELGRRGKSKTVMAAELECTRKTLDNWAEANPEFLHALTRAQILSQAWWENAGQSGLTADKFNSSVWSRSMAARFPDDWRESTRHEQTGANGGPIEYANLTEAEIDARLADLARGAGPAEPTEEA